MKRGDDMAKRNDRPQISDAKAAGSEQPQGLISVKRPTLITILAWLLIVASIIFLLAKPLTWSEMSFERNVWNVFTKSVALVCGAGLLKMRKWAVVLYFVMFGLNTALLFVWPPMPNIVQQYSRPSAILMLLFVPILVAIITLPEWDRMTWGRSRA